MLMDNLRKQALKFGTKIQNSYVDSVEFGPDKKILKMGDKTLETKSVIIAVSYTHLTLPTILLV